MSHKKLLYAFSIQDQVINLLMPDGHMKIEERYRLCAYNDMINHGHLKKPGSHVIDVKMSHEPKTKPKLWSLANRNRWLKACSKKVLWITNVGLKKIASGLKCACNLCPVQQCLC